MNLCQVLIPAVSDKKMQEIQEKLGVPIAHAEAEFVNLTDWVKHGTLPQ